MAFCLSSHHMPCCLGNALIRQIIKIWILPSESGYIFSLIRSFSVFASFCLFFLVFKQLFLKVWSTVYNCYFQLNKLRNILLFYKTFSSPHLYPFYSFLVNSLPEKHPQSLFLWLWFCFFCCRSTYKWNQSLVSGIFY